MRKKKYNKKHKKNIGSEVTQIIKNSKKPSDVICHKGDFGKEPMIIVFGENPNMVLKKILKIIWCKFSQNLSLNINSQQPNRICESSYSCWWIRYKTSTIHNISSKTNVAIRWKTNLGTSNWLDKKKWYQINCIVC